MIINAHVYCTFFVQSNPLVKARDDLNVRF